MPYCALAIVTHRMDGMIKPLSRELITKHIKHYEQQKIEKLILITSNI